MALEEAPLRVPPETTGDQSAKLPQPSKSLGVSKSQVRGREETEE